MRTHLLSKDEYLATMLQPAVNVTTSATDVLDIWPYVAAVPAADLWGHQTRPELIEAVYRLNERFDHVLVLTTTPNVYLVVIVDLFAGAVAGHHLLDLKEEYGLRIPQ